MKDFFISLTDAHKGDAFDIIGGGKSVLDWRPTGRKTIAMNRACLLPDRYDADWRHFYDYEVLYDRTVSSSEWYRYGMAKRVLMAYRIINLKTYDPQWWENEGCEVYGYHCDCYPIAPKKKARWNWNRQLMTLVSSGGVAMHAAIVMGAAEIYLWGCTWTGKNMAHWDGSKTQHDFARSGRYIIHLANHAKRIGVKLYAKPPNILLDKELAEEI